MATARIRIAARLRPQIPGEIEDDAVDVREEDGLSYITVAHPRDPCQRFKFKFSSCYGQSSTQQQIFENDVQPMIDIVFSGVTVTVFAYGVTSSGKTHTMQGTNSDPGVIPRVVMALFKRTDHPPNSTVSLSVSYVEIYKDEVFDLMVDRETAPKLPIRENDSGQVFVANVTRHPIVSSAEFDLLYATATKRRSTGATNLNRASSRSHAILTIEVQMVDYTAGTTTTGKINLVDLAGSENNKLTGNDPSRMAESAAINKSLSVLGQVVHALNQGASRIPYRNSKLTRILQDALGGSAVGLLICNLAPGLKFRGDTWNTLNFATRTKEIENKPIVNVRDTRPAPKAHFAAHPAPAPKSIAAPLPSCLTTKPGRSGSSRLSLGQAGPSKLPGPSRGRASAFGLGPGAIGVFQPFALPQTGGVHDLGGTVASGSSIAPNSAVGIGMTEAEIDERISRAVEQEVTRRLEERERQRKADEEKLNMQQEQQQLGPPQNSTPVPTVAPQPVAMPSGLLTPLLQRHQDLDNELKRRLEDLESKYERGNKEVQLADVLSPSSKRKTGRAYVALARAHSEKGDLQVALELYRKATSYVPDNVKLRERIIEIDWAIQNDVEFVPEPKKKKVKSNSGRKGRKTDESLGTEGSGDHDEMEQDNDDGASDIAPEIKQGAARERRKKVGGGHGPLGEATNSPSKRRAEGCLDGGDMETPPKKQKKGRKVVQGSEDWLTGAPVKGKISMV